LPVSVIAAERSEILLIDYRKIVTTCSSACAFHARLIENMLRILAEKNILLTRKLVYFSQRTIREKLLSFLSDQAVREGSDAENTVVEIAFNRQELADYLCVDRSALSRELGVMQTEGLIRYHKNRFEIMANDGQRR
jgi:CRP-like cAMP-binding protein